MLLKDEFLYKWAEVSGFDFRKLLEDNQNLSLPMITLVDNTPVIFAFVYSCLPNNKVVVSQRHFWDRNEHQMMLCKNSYNINLNDISLNESVYLETLSNVAEILFADNLSLESKTVCQKYFSCFHNEYLKKLYFSENKPLAQWAMKQSLI